MLDHEKRRMAIGGSEIAALFGLDSFADEFAMWARKTSGEYTEPTLEQQVGTILETPLLRDIYPMLSGREITLYNQTAVDPERPWIAYTPDGLVPGERRGVEAKTVLWHQSRQWGLNADEIPARVILQVSWYMAALDYDLWDVIALIGGEPRLYTVHRDLEMEKVILERAKNWWERYLIGGQTPPITGSEVANKWLKRRFPEHRPADLVKPTDGTLILLDEYNTLRANLAGMEKRREDIEAKLKLAVGEHEGFAWDSGKFTWKKRKDSKTTDWQSLAIALATNFVRDETERGNLYAEYTRTTPGERAIYFASERLKAAKKEAA